LELAENYFERLPKEEKTSEEIVRPSMTFWQDAWRRLRKNRLAMIGMYVLIAIILIAIFGPMISPYTYSDQTLSMANQPPSSAHPFGMDNLGRDLMTRVFYGARISLSIGFIVAACTLVIGILYGGISGYVGGMVDTVMMRIVDVLYIIPSTLYVILLMLIIGPGFNSVIIALGATSWLGMARQVRGQVLSLKEQEFVLAAKALGADSRRILLRHLIPNSLGPIIVVATMQIPNAIFNEAFLSFIGLGVSAPEASWGVLCNDALPALRTAPHELFFPALAITITMLAFSFFGDGLRDALDPKMRK